MLVGYRKPEGALAKQKLRKYELIYIVQPEATEEERNKVAERVDRVVESMGGAYLKKEEWGKRKLAYEIRKQNKGYYYYLVIVGAPGLTQEIERILRMLDNCIRFMTIKLEEGIDPETLVEILEPEEPQEVDQKEVEDA